MRPRSGSETQKKESTAARDTALQLEENLRLAARAVHSNEETERSDVLKEAERLVAKSVAGGKLATSINASAVQAGIYAQRAVELRCFLRKSCARHGWDRSVDPAEVLANEKFDECPSCSDWCGGTLEEYTLYLEAGVELGRLNSDRLKELLERARHGFCCGVGNTAEEYDAEVRGTGSLQRQHCV